MAAPLEQSTHENLRIPYAGLDATRFGPFLSSLSRRLNPMFAPMIASSAGALVLTTFASAQVHTAQASPITSQVKDAGVYHMATGTWTRGVHAAALAGPEVLYDNTCEVGYYWGLDTRDRMIDSGRIPSTSSPAGPNSLPGLHDLYEVNGFTVGYCAYEPVVTSFDLSFIECYTACDGGGVFPTPIITFNIVNVPGGTAFGAQGCWILTFDLSNGGTPFQLGGDCNGVFNNAASTDSFGWSWMQSIPTTGSNAGPIFAGDPQNHFPSTVGVACAGLGGGSIGDGTTFLGAGAGPGSGLGSTDQVELVGGLNPPGCFWFGGYDTLTPANPMSAFYLQLQGQEGFGPANHCTAVCLGDGTGNACPCGNVGAGGAGCANSSGQGATLTCTGEAMMSLDTLSMHISGVPGAKPGLLFKGSALHGGGGGLNTVTGSAGLLCSAGATARSAVQVTDASGATTFTTWDGVNGLGVVATVGVPAYFQFWYRDPMGSPCTGTSFNFSGAVRTTYLP